MFNREAIKGRQVRRQKEKIFWRPHHKLGCKIKIEKAKIR
jgi:hypothetical protein